MSWFSFLPPLIGAASKAGVVAITVSRERRLQQLEEQRRFLVTFFKPAVETNDLSALESSLFAQVAKERGGITYVAFLEDDWIQVKHAIKKLEELDSDS